MCRAQAEPKRQVRTQLILLQNQAKRLPSQNPRHPGRGHCCGRADPADAVGNAGRSADPLPPPPRHCASGARTALQNALLVALGPGQLRLGCEVGDVAPGRVTLTNGEVLACDLVVDAGSIRAPSNTGAPPSYAGYGGVLALSGRVAGLGLDGVAAEYWGRHQRFGVLELPDNRRYWFLMRTQPVTALMPDRADGAQSWPGGLSGAGGCRCPSGDRRRGRTCAGGGPIRAPAPQACADVCAGIGAGTARCSRAATGAVPDARDTPRHTHGPIRTQTGRHAHHARLCRARGMTALPFEEAASRRPARPWPFA